ncbi:MAG: hypothetical protein C0600_03330 [Ignavibacteria bacterium]|nr:MAG: hypothetical protein C0600_03330 [Ignavibacteria bacterium]
MRTAVPVIALLLLLCSVAGAEKVERPGKNTSLSQADFVPGMMFIKLKNVQSVAPGAKSFGLQNIDKVLHRIMTTSVEALHPSLSLRKGYTSPEEESLARIMLVRYSAPVDALALAEEISADPAVEYAEPFINLRPTHTPDDPRLSTQWAIASLKMEEAWDITMGDSTIVIGYIDSGVNYNHEDLAGSIWVNPGEWGTNGELKDNGVDDDGNGYTDDWRGWDFIGNGTLQAPNPDNDPMDFNGHGTNGAGVAAARTNNGKGIAGIGYHTKILPIKVQDDANTTGMAGYWAVRYAADMGCKVINASWGSNALISQVLQDEIDYAWSKGALMVGGAGNAVINNDLDPFIPASLNHVLSVSSIEQDGSASPWAAFGSSVHVYAPGTDVLAPRMSFGYQNVTGTSFSAPMMSGLAALIFAIHPDWTPDQVLKQIRVTSDKFGTEYEALHYGRANAYKALSMNASLDEIPGLEVKSYDVMTSAGSQFTEAGQEASVQVVIENLLAPTSNAMVELEVDPAYGTLNTTSATLGAMNTMESMTISFTLTLTENPTMSEGYIPVILKFTDGQYLDFDLVRIELNLTDGWHTSLDLRYPYNSIDIPDRWNVWVSGDFTENGVPTQDIAIRSTDAGDSWVFAFGTGYPDGKGVYCIDGIDEFSALVGTGPTTGAAEVYRTNDGGQSWSGTSVASMTPFVNWIHMFDDNEGILQGDPNSNIWGIATTSDGGYNWTPISNPLSAATGEAGWNNSYDFIGDHGWFGTNSSIIYRTTDRGQNWQSYPVPSKNATDITFRDQMTGVARFSEQNSQGTDTLAVTTDGGLTWSLISTIAAPYGSVVFERGGERLWFMTSGNAYASTDLGVTWNVQATPLSFDFVNDAAEWNDGFVSKVFAAGIEIFKYESPHKAVVSVQNPISQPESPRILSVYPQPASAYQGSLTAEISLTQAEPVVLALYDMSGRKVREVVNATLGIGTHSASVSIGNLAAGSYVLRMTTPKQTVARNVMVIN